MKNRETFRMYFIAATTAISLLSLFFFRGLQDKLRPGWLERTKQKAFQVSQAKVVCRLVPSGQPECPEFKLEMVQLLDGDIFQVTSYVDFRDKSGTPMRVSYVDRMRINNGDGEFDQISLAAQPMKL